MRSLTQVIQNLTPATPSPMQAILSLTQDTPSPTPEIRRWCRIWALQT
jgi:hypothetical protein